MRCIPAVWSSLLALLPVLTWTASVTAKGGRTASQPAPSKTSARLSLFFEANRGQWPE